MAQRRITIYTDDLSGEEGGDVTTRRFSVDGADYEIDLSLSNRQQMDTALAPYVAAGRRIRRAPRSR